MKLNVKFYQKKIEIAVANGETTYYYSDLMYIKYDEPYCWLHFIDGKKHKVEVSLKYLLENLPQRPFFRCNRAEVVNLCYYKGIQKEPPAIFLENEAKSDIVKFRLSVRNISSFKSKKAGLTCISPPCRVHNNGNSSDQDLYCIVPKLTDKK